MTLVEDTLPIEGNAMLSAKRSSMPLVKDKVQQDNILPKEHLQNLERLLPKRNDVQVKRRWNMKVAKSIMSSKTDKG